MDWGMGPEIDESAVAAAAAAAVATTAASIREEELIRNDEENKKRAAAADLQNRLEYQKAQNDKAILKEIMTRVSCENKASYFKLFYFLYRLMNLQKMMILIRKKNLFISQIQNVL
jgi:hypothetical protein